jgi:hypothetical protein
MWFNRDVVVIVPVQFDAGGCGGSDQARPCTQDAMTGRGTSNESS